MPDTEIERVMMTIYHDMCVIEARVGGSRTLVSMVIILLINIIHTAFRPTSYTMLISATMAYFVVLVSQVEACCSDRAAINRHGSLPSIFSIGE